MLIYFAYGSNMSRARLEQRVGPVHALGVGRLRDYRHSFTKRGRDGTGKGTIAPAPGGLVLGALYKLTPTQFDALRAFETGYRQIRCTVDIGLGDDDNAGSVALPGTGQADVIAACSFQAEQPVSPMTPTDEYVQHYMNGMRELGIPAAYRDDIRAQARATLADDKPEVEQSTKKRHRGQRPADAKLFSAAQVPAMQTATYELSWLHKRGYGETSAVKLVGDRHGLRKRQRQAVQRCACADDARDDRLSRKREPAALAGRTVWIDGFNAIIAIEAALSGGVIVVGRDRAHRDMSSVHGSYRRVEETHDAISRIARLLSDSGAVAVRWLLDKPVSNSGRLATMIRQAAPDGIPWAVELVYNPDRELCVPGDRVTASGDAWVLDHCGDWVDIPGAVIARGVPQAWIVDLNTPAPVHAGQKKHPDSGVF